MSKSRHDLFTNKAIILGNECHPNEVIILISRVLDFFLVPVFLVVFGPASNSHFFLLPYTIHGLFNISHTHNVSQLQEKLRVAVLVSKAAFQFIQGKFLQNISKMH